MVRGASHEALCPLQSDFQRVSKPHSPQDNRCRITTFSTYQICVDKRLLSAIGARIGIAGFPLFAMLIYD